MLSFCLIYQICLNLILLVGYSLSRRISTFDPKPLILEEIYDENGKFTGNYKVINNKNESN